VSKPPGQEKDSVIGPAKNSTISSEQALVDTRSACARGSNSATDHEVRQRKALKSLLWVRMCEVNEQGYTISCGGSCRSRYEAANDVPIAINMVTSAVEQPAAISEAARHPINRSAIRGISRCPQGATRISGLAHTPQTRAYPSFCVIRPRTSTSRSRIRGLTFGTSEC
jgi:hypothetical protein